MDRRVDMATIGYRMNTRHQGKGLATKAAKVLLRNGFRQEGLIRQGQL